LVSSNVNGLTLHATHPAFRGASRSCTVCT
jgi:hypothetical protein